MLFSATYTHPASKCPLEMPEGKAMIKKLFSDENVKKLGLKIVVAYISCPKDKSAEHKGYFIVEADSPAAVTKFFGPMTVDVRPVVPLSEVTKTLQENHGLRLNITLFFFQNENNHSYTKD